MVIHVGLVALAAAGCSIEVSENDSQSDGDGSATMAGGSGGASSDSGGDGATNGGASTRGGAKSGGASSSGGESGSSSAGSVGAGGHEDGSGGTDTSRGGSSGGSSSGGEACAMADEGQAASLSCSEGQRIESVIFASYGTPIGSCGSFSQGACHAKSSEGAVADLCVGRESCTIPATNSTFSDPCNSTVKSLAVEVECAVGQPTVEPLPYKGIANSPAAEIEELGATWCYNWTVQPSESDCGDPLFVPMIWEGGNVAEALAGIADAGYDTVLGFNEPNKVDQANMSVAEAVAQWPEITSDPNIRVGSPAVSDDGRAWLEEFMDQVEANGLRVDFIAMHWYGWNEGSCTASQLEAAVNWASQWELPVWITEFGCMGSSNTDEQTVLTFLDEAVQMLENHPQVERYAWYPWNTYNHLYLPDENDVRQRTALGDAFLAAPAYR